MEMCLRSFRHWMILPRATWDNYSSVTTPELQPTTQITTNFSRRQPTLTFYLYLPSSNIYNGKTIKLVTLILHTQEVKKKRSTLIMNFLRFVKSHIRSTAVHD